MGPSTAPTAWAQRHGAGRAGASPEHPPGTLTPQGRFGPRQDRGTGAVGARLDVAEAMPALGGPLGAEGGGSIHWGAGETTARGITLWGGHCPRHHHHPGQPLAPGQGLRLSLSPPSRAEPSPPLRAPPRLLCPFKRTPGVARGLSSHPAGHGTGQSRTALDRRRQPHWHTVDRSLHRYRARAGAGGDMGGTRGGEPGGPAPCPWTRLWESESWGTADARGHL